LPFSRMELRFYSGKDSAVNRTSAIEPEPGPARFTLFLALSRTPHGILDMATPILGALLWLGAFPPRLVMIVGGVTVFAGYTAVYALNDLTDFRVDSERARLGTHRSGEDYLDDLLVRHPMARGLIRFREGVWWTAFWASVAMAGAYFLNPVCGVIFLCGCALEVIYCRLLKVSYLRTFISGAVKTSGAVAAVFAVDPSPSPIFVLVLFLWLFFWEVGGQNIPHDWADIEEDRRLDSKTVPVRFGPAGSTWLILICLVLTVVSGTTVFYAATARYGVPFVSAAGMVGVYMLLIPGVRLFKTRERARAMALFNRASYYPSALLGMVMIRLIFIDFT